MGLLLFWKEKFVAVLLKPRGFVDWVS